MKRLLFALLLVLACHLTNAQKKGDFELGLSAGWSLSNVSSPQKGPGMENNLRTAFNAGLSANYFLADQWSLKAKLIFDQKGLEGSFLRRPMDQASGYSYRDNYSNFELDYLTVPISVNWHFAKIVRFSIGLGGYAGLLLKSNEQEYQAIYGDRFYFNKTDFGAVGSLNVKYPFTNTFSVGLEYERQQGFSDLYGHANTSPTHRNSRNAFNVGVYYIL